MVQNGPDSRGFVQQPPRKATVVQLESSAAQALTISVNVVVCPDAEWSPLEGEGDGEETRHRFEAQLKRILGAERLVVLAELGTSFAIGNAGRAPAPSMTLTVKGGRIFRGRLGPR
jgi:hypothetical protein